MKITNLQLKQIIKEVLDEYGMTSEDSSLLGALPEGSEEAMIDWVNSQPEARELGVELTRLQYDDPVQVRLRPDSAIEVTLNMQFLP